MYKEIQARSPKLRLVQVGFDKKTTKNYISEDNALRAVEDHAEKLIGSANCRIVEFEGRFYPIFYCFNEEQDMISTSWAGFVVHR